jgi:uncharacterized membrane-anchored protein
MLNAPLRILIVASVCVLALIGLVVREGAARDGGEEVLLAMEAVDPRALLSGHYVMIRLQEVLPDGEPCPAHTIYEDWIGPAPREGLPGRWVALRPAGDAHRVAASTPTREEALRVAPIVAEGEVFCTPPVATPDTPVGNAAVLRLDLGIDRFYASQGEAERIDRILRERSADAARVFAIVSIGADGRARLKGLMVDGERLELTWF